jgi:hypothetical protein
MICLFVLVVVADLVGFVLVGEIGLLGLASLNWCGDKDASQAYVAGPLRRMKEERSGFQFPTPMMSARLKRNHHGLLTSSKSRERKRHLSITI